MSPTLPPVPFIEASDLHHRFQRVMELTGRLERAAAQDTLAEAVDEREIRDVLGEGALDHYRECLAFDAGLPPFRRTNGAVLAQRLASSLKEPVIRFDARRIGEAPAKETARAPRLPRFSHEVSDQARVQAALVHGQSEPLTFRLDQMLASRRWGIGFDLEDEVQTAWIENVYGYGALRRWVSDLNDLLRIDRWLRRRPRVTHVPQLDGPEAIGFRFERLMLDVLNRAAYRARLAPLREDVVEKTDLRVHVPGVRRSRGVRVQIGMGARFDAANRKQGSFQGSRQVVLLTPATLVLALVEGDLLGAEERASLWDALSAVPEGVEALSREVRDLFVGALKSAPSDPRGPCALLPAELAVASGRYVDREALRDKA